MGVLQLRSLAFGLAAAATASAGTVSVPFSRQPLLQVLSISKRDGLLTLEALNNVTMGGYIAEFQIGTPPQPIFFQLDTGSSDTWVNTPTTDLCSSAQLQSTMGYCLNTYDPTDSSTFSSEGRNDFDISYLDGRRIQGDYFTDAVTIGDAVVSNQTLGLATQSVRPTGLMGLGFSHNVAADEPYPTILDNLFTQGHINSRAFSLYLNEIVSDSGVVLFGGIDSQKYIGDLTFLPLVPDLESYGNTEIRSWNVDIDHVAWRIEGEVEGQTDRDANTTALLDSGSTVTLIPESLAENLFERYDTRAVRGLNIRFIDCAWRGSRGQDHEFEFVFDGKTIRVPLSEMVIDPFTAAQVELFGSSLAPPELRDIHSDYEGRICMFGMDSMALFGLPEDSMMILGDTFLRSAYVVYDMENLEIAIAQANINEERSNIVEIPANSTRIPRVSGSDGQTGGDRGGNDDGDGADDDADNGAGSVLPSISLAVSVMVGLFLSLGL